MIGKILMLPFWLILKVVGLVLGIIKLVLSFIWGIISIIFNHLFGTIFGALIGLLLGRKHIGVKLFNKKKRHVVLPATK